MAERRRRSGRVKFCSAVLPYQRLDDLRRFRLELREQAAGDV